MRFGELTRLSPNRAGAPHERLGILFHHSGLRFEETIARMSDAASRVSYHCLVDADGTRCTMVPDNEIAWHAGASKFMGRTRCNDFLLGLSFAGDTYRSPLTPAQLESALEWLVARWAPLGWDLARMTDHRQASPGRKLDLNPVEWERLATAISERFGAKSRAFPC